MFPIKDNLRSCPICRDRRSEVLHRQRFVLPAGHPMGSGYNVVCCQNRGFVFANVAVTQAELNRYYAQQSKYADQKTSSGGGESAEDLQRLHGMALENSKYFPDRHIRLLEIGCANGGLLREFKRMGYTSLAGMDPSPACVEHTRQVGVDAFVGKKYIEISNKLLGILDQKIQAITSTHPEWIVWGTGQLALKLLAETALGKAHIAAFVDSNPVNQGKILLGKPILAPTQLASSEMPILITTNLHSQAIQDAIRSLHLQNPVFT